MPAHATQQTDKKASAVEEHHHNERHLRQAHQVQHAQQTEIRSAQHSSSSPTADCDRHYSFGTSHALGQALGHAEDMTSGRPIAFGPALDQYIQQLETTLREEPLVLDAVLQVLHEYQARHIHSAAMQRQVRQLG